MTTNTLFYGDNLKVLRDHIPTASVDLVYLDPPFNSNRNYNVLFKEKSGEASPAQIEVFTDTWEWDRVAEQTFEDLVTDGPPNVAEMIGAMRSFVGSNDMMAYLVMMAVRLVELHRVLKPTGSLYLHCDPTASHYLKILLDTIFGKEHFKNEIIWKRTTAHSSSKKYAPIHDTLLYYGRSAHVTWNELRSDYDEAYLAKYYRFHDGDDRLYWRADLTGAGTRKGPSGQPWRGFNPATIGRHWIASPETLDRYHAEGRIYYPQTGGMPQFKKYRDELKGKAVADIWDDVDRINPVGNERLGYPTQKPLALVERIIAASSNPGDVVLDPFCGCGTAVVAAEKLGRHWIGIDVTHLAIALMRFRLNESFPGVQFAVKGEPTDVGGAQALAAADRYQFQWWALSLVHAKPVDGKEKKGADQGIDGAILFIDDASRSVKRCLVQVKSGHVNSATMRDLNGTIKREKAEMGILVTLEPPTGPMRKEAVQEGSYHSEAWNRDYPRVQIVTVEELLHGVRPDVPPTRSTFSSASRISDPAATKSSQFDLFDL